ncbi:hypothetical protein B5M09_003408 [Aphanomyces astaci]|uniref:Uncharacterized protein n=1 Tax=Aphanomyces astaci TaxID=112090 RepID=A0A3R7YV91_APHAT|nr:hypothetical protein B5M09_003408 [Aphanomyces astaci]
MIGATPTKTYRLASSALQISPSVGTFPVLPSVLVQGETLASLVVSLTTSATISVVANVNANHSFVILPSASLRGLSSPQTISISVQGGEKDATGVYTIRFTSMTTNETLYSSQVTVVPPPQAYSVQEGAWTGTTLASDTFDALPFGAIPNASTSIWTAIEHGFASDTCGKVGSTGNALYFTHLGNRMASTTPFDLRGIDAQLSFAYIYGHLPNESYDGYGNNTLSCEQVQPGAEVSVEISRDNGTTWQRLVTIPLSSPPSDNIGTRYQWQYRNLFDQWAIDNVLLTARVQPPKLLATTATSGRDALTVQVITSSSNGVVLTTVGDGSHAFPVCPSNASTAVASNATVTLRTTGFIHAVTCWRGSQSYGYRSPRLYIQSPPPTFQITTTVNQTYVINVTMPRPNMQLWFTFGTGNDMPSCTFGSYLNVTSGVTATMDVGSNGVLRALACGRGLVGSEILQTCPSFGVVSEVWALDMSGVQAAVAASPALPYADLWRASLNQERTVPYVQFSFGPSITDTQVHSFVLQWNRTAGRANVYRDGQLIRKLRALPASPDPAPLTFHSWVPNAWAGEPRFDSCSTQVSNVQVVKLETAANRWCDWEDAVGGGGGVECDSDATCSQWMTTACLMPVASAVCVNNTCVFGLHPQFASPAVKAASAFHMTISNTHGIQIHVRMDHEQPDVGKRVKKPAKKQPQPLDNFAAAFAAKSMEERIQAHKKSMLLAFESIELVADDDDGLPQFSLDFQGVDLNGGGIPGFEVDRASAISLTWFIPHILLSIDLSFANLTDVGCYPIAT